VYRYDIGDYSWFLHAADNFNHGILMIVLPFKTTLKIPKPDNKQR
jgi:hypothetical protein